MIIEYKVKTLSHLKMRLFFNGKDNNRELSDTNLPI